MQKHVILCVNFTVWYRDSVNNTVEENSNDIVFSIILMRWLPSARALHQQNPPVLNWSCWLMQIDLYNGCISVVVAVVV